MAARIVGDENRPGVSVGTPLHAAAIDTLTLPEIDEQVAERVFAQRGEIADRGTLPCGGDGRVGGVATEALQPVGLAGPGLVELCLLYTSDAADE